METVQPDQRAWDEALLDRITAHISAERGVLTDYAAAAETTEAADVRYLIRLILDDERRHHRVFEEMARAVRSTREWRHLDPQVPEMAGRPLPDAVRELTERLLEVERDDARELRSLRRELKPVADTTLWALLVDIMALDTEKHQRILRFIVDHADG